MIGSLLIVEVIGLCGRRRYSYDHVEKGALVGWYDQYTMHEIENKE